MFQQPQQRMHENRCKNGDHQCNGNTNNDTGCNGFFHPFRLLSSKASRRDDREPVSDAERKSGHHFIDRRAGTHSCNRRIAECMADNQCVHRVVNLLKYTGCHDRKCKKKQRFQNRAVKQINRELRWVCDCDIKNFLPQKYFIVPIITDGSNYRTRNISKSVKQIQ